MTLSSFQPPAAHTPTPVPRRRRAHPLLCFTLLLLLTAPLRAPAAPLNDQLPPDTLVFIELDPTAAPAADSQSALLDFGVQALQSTGILSKKASEIGDILALAAAAGQHHSCIALLDADLAASATDLECRSVQLAWVLDTAGQSADMVDRLTHLLAHLSSRKTAQQSIHKTPEEKREYVEFHDTTWPNWLTLDWTRQGDLFILTLGSGAMDHYLADHPVGGLPWQQTLTDADAAAAKQGALGNPFARIYVTPAAFRQRFPDAMHKTQLGQLFATLDLFTTDASLFSARIHDRAISMDNATTTAGILTDSPWTLPLPANSPLLKLIPPQATAYLALNVQWPALWTRLMALVDAIAPDAAGEAGGKAEQVIQAFAAQQGVNIRTDILAKLQPIVLIHDAPQHPLRLPLMVTAIAAADPPQADAVKTAFAKLLNPLAADLDRKAGPTHEVSSDFTHFRLRTDPDGVTYTQFGLVGPAWTWIGNKLLFSWSPAAVRANESVVSGAAGAGFGGK